MSTPKNIRQSEGLQGHPDTDLRCNNGLKAALEYLSIGWQPLPARHATKSPHIDRWKDLQKNYTLTEQWFRDHYAANPTDGVGIITGNGVIVIDKDAQSPEWLADIESHGGLTSTLEAISTPAEFNSGTSKGHLFYSLPRGVEIRNDVRSIWGGIDIRGDGGFVVCAPSVHESGTHKYQWVDWTIPVAPCPQWIIEKAKKTSRPVGRPPKNAPLTNRVPDGARHAFLASRAGTYVNGGSDREAVLEHLEIDNRRCDPPVEPGDLVGLAAQSGSWESTYTLDRFIGESTLNIRLMSEIERTRLQWIWKPWIPKGKLTILGGDGDVAKSFLLCDIVAKITNGWNAPDGTHMEKGKVLWLSEETSSDVLRPRLEEAGADLTMVTELSSDGFNLKTGLFDLDLILEAGKYDLLIIDPIESWSGIDGNHPNQVRTMLDGVKRLLERHMIGCIGVRHITKALMERSINKIGGALDWVNTARSVIGVDLDPTDDSIRIMAHLKSNNAPKAPKPLSYVLEPGKDIEYARVQWRGEVNMKHKDIWVERAEGEKLADATEFLKEKVPQGGMEYTNILKKEADDLGISWASIRRAQIRLSIKPRKSPDGPWAWYGSECST